MTQSSDTQSNAARLQEHAQPVTAPAHTRPAPIQGRRCACTSSSPMREGHIEAHPASGLVLVGTL
eukprot:1160413-Pelagomonas_calceolata.AAC.1